MIVVKVINFDGVEIEYEDSLFHRWSFLKGLHESSRQFSCMDELLCGKSDQVAEKLGDDMDRMTALLERIATIEGNTGKN